MCKVTHKDERGDARGGEARGEHTGEELRRHGISSIWSRSDFVGLAVMDMRVCKVHGELRLRENVVGFAEMLSKVDCMMMMWWLVVVGGGIGGGYWLKRVQRISSDSNGRERS